MNFAVIIARELGIQPWQAEAVIKLLDEGGTVPFIARYRKEQHGELDDQKVREVSERLESLRKLDERRQEISELLKKQEVWTEELQRELDAAATVGRLEDIYRPYRPKRRTRAMIAREKGLEGLANILLLQLPDKKTPEQHAQAYVDAEKGVSSVEEALQGAMDIIAEQVSDDANVRARLKSCYQASAVVRTAAAKEEDSVYRMYYDRAEPLRLMAPHRVLAVNRGEKEGFLKVSLEVDETACLRLIGEDYLIGTGSKCTEYVRRACEDGYSRLIAPSLENEMRAMLTETAQASAIQVFAMNLRPLLMQPPLRGKTVIGLDPGIAHGCKVAVVDPTGRVLDTAVIYPLPHQKQVERAKTTVKQLIRRHHVEAAAIGNGTAGKETELFFAEVMREMPETPLGYMVVSEAGASVYSASKLAAEEFPQFDVNLRSAVSIARRLQDPLAELVKIDPKALGVGQYQHDVKASALDAALDGVVEACVNQVGVDVNTASVSLLSHVAGINATLAKNIVAYRDENGPFASRAALKKVPRLGPKAFEQCAGFLRVPGARDAMENTGVHPESYPTAKALLQRYGLTARDAAEGRLRPQVEAEGYEAVAGQLGCGVPTLRDIVLELSKPGRDPRDELPQPQLRTDVLSMEDLQAGMALTGTVRNVTDFGAFVDIGVHQDGLVHLSQLGRRVRHPSEVLRVGDVVTVYVLNVDIPRKRIALTLRKPETPPQPKA